LARVRFINKLATGYFVRPPCMLPYLAFTFSSG